MWVFNTCTKEQLLPHTQHGVTPHVVINYNILVAKINHGKTDTSVEVMVK